MRMPSGIHDDVGEPSSLEYILLPARRQEGRREHSPGSLEERRRSTSSTSPSSAKSAKVGEVSRSVAAGAGEGGSDKDRGRQKERERER